MDPNNHPLLHTGEVRISTLPETCLHPTLFERAWSLRPGMPSKVYIRENGPHPAHRTHVSYGNTPSMASDAQTYMYSANGTVSDTPIPDIFLGIQDHLNKVGGGQYNQLVVNWYRDGTDYCPFHHDCLTGLRPNSNVAIVTLMDPDATDTRPLVFKPNKRFVSSTKLFIPTTHGQCVEFGGTALTHWRHGIPKQQQYGTRRISLSFRSILPPGAKKRWFALTADQETWGGCSEQRKSKFVIEFDQSGKPSVSMLQYGGVKKARSFVGRGEEIASIALPNGRVEEVASLAGRIEDVIGQALAIQLQMDEISAVRGAHEDGEGGGDGSYHETRHCAICNRNIGGGNVGWFGHTSSRKHQRRAQNAYRGTL